MNDKDINRVYQLYAREQLSRQQGQQKSTLEPVIK